MSTTTMSAPASSAALAWPPPGSSTEVSYQSVSSHSAAAGSAAMARRSSSPSIFTGLYTTAAREREGMCRAYGRAAGRHEALTAAPRRVKTEHLNRFDSLLTPLMGGA